jgi:multimeric flavodoxin WrbA
MEKELIVINPATEGVKRDRLESILEYSLEGKAYEEITSLDEMKERNLRDKRILFALALGESGINIAWYEMMQYLRVNNTALEGCVGGVILDGYSEFYTKSTGRSLVFTANMAGCTFPGRPLVEGTKTLKNYNIQAQNLNTDNLGAYKNAGRELVDNILNYDNPAGKAPKLLVLHASDNRTSNSLALWGMIKENLHEFEIKEISLRNGQVMDCRGCSYETCLHFGEEGDCYYGGPIADKVYPAVLECDGLVMVCPNYNDALGGNLTAFINRLSALFRAHRFYDKALFGVVVSGYSGGDIVAEQLISGLNMNKTFALPGKFAILETANNPRAILESPGIRDRALEYSMSIKSHYGL